MTLGTSLDSSLSVLDCVWTKTDTLLIDLLDDDNDAESHMFEESNVSLLLHSSSKLRTDFFDGRQVSFQSFNGSDLGSSGTSNSSESSFFNVKEKSERPIPKRRASRIVAPPGNNSQSLSQPNNSLLGLLEGTSAYEFTPELISPKKISNAHLECQRQVQRLKSHLSGIPLASETKKNHLGEAIDKCDKLERSNCTRRSISETSSPVTRSSEQQEESKRKQLDSPTSNCSSNSPHIQRRESKRGTPEALKSFHKSEGRSNIILRRNENCISPIKRKSPINSKANASSLKNYLSNQKSSMANYIIHAEEQSASVSSVSCTSVDSEISFDSNDTKPSSPRRTYEIASHNSFPSPKMDGNGKKSLSISNRGRDLHRSVSSAVTMDSICRNKSHRSSDDSAPKPPRRSISKIVEK